MEYLSYNEADFVAEPKTKKLKKKKHSGHSYDDTNLNTVQQTSYLGCYEPVESQYFMENLNQNAIGYYCDGFGNSNNNKMPSAAAMEKSRLMSINKAFEILRTSIPTFPYERRLSKIDTLHLAISYISLLQSVLESHMSLFDYLNTSLKSSLDLSEPQYCYNQNNFGVTSFKKPSWATSGK